ncbi:uncharacterized protein ARMOST_14528 [Armillaria ostoyae]|uniref:Uncharacterized protein n=1 Tax=Armillaria ostoyae TaxID=47428 RepID=A0A284RR07_ARMOS|nr:uncharacterized protein ARMOST_14528 [Armillaria ostoyae]
MASPALGKTLGAVYIGATIAAILFGITILQTAIYYQRFRKDWWVYRYSVALLWILDALHVALSTHALYFYLIENFGNLEVLNEVVWSFKLQLLFDTLTVVGVQTIYAVRLCRSAGNSSSRAPQVTLSSLASLVSSLKQQQEMQSTEIGRIKNRIQRLEKENEDLRAENSDLWNEINKIKGPRFPPELFDRFIDFLHHDNEALKACSLVCRAWIPASRFHLFEHIYFAVLSNRRRMVELLDSSFCTLFKYVREITVDGNIDDGHPVPMMGIPLSWLQPLAQYLDRFTGVTVLCLRCITTASIRYIINSPRFTSRITNLMLYGIVCSTFNDLPYVLSYFSKLEILTYDVHFCDILTTDDCSDCGMDYMADMYAETLAIDGSPYPPPATLQVIVNDNYGLLSGCCSAGRSALCNWLRVGDHTCLRTMLLGYLSHENKDEIMALSSYLHGPGATLKHLKLGFGTTEAMGANFFTESIYV